jgi:hypothetical protein
MTSPRLTIRDHKLSYLTLVTLLFLGPRRHGLNRQQRRLALIGVPNAVTNGRFGRVRAAIQSALQK